MTEPDFDSMTRDQLSSWYIEEVGYDLAAEDPSVTDDIYRQMCREVYLEGAQPASNNHGHSDVTNQEREAWTLVGEKLPFIDESRPAYSQHVSCLVVTDMGYTLPARFARNSYARTEKGRIPRWEHYDGNRLLAFRVLAWRPFPEASKEEVEQIRVRARP